MKKVLITGATGFIGGNLLLGNLTRGNSVRAMVLPGDAGAARLKELGVEVVEGDIRDFEAVKRAASGREIVFHCAAVVTDWAPKKLFRSHGGRRRERLPRGARGGRLATGRYQHLRRDRRR